MSLVQVPISRLLLPLSPFLVPQDSTFLIYLNEFGKVPFHDILSNPDVSFTKSGILPMFLWFFPENDINLCLHLTSKCNSWHLLLHISISNNQVLSDFTFSVFLERIFLFLSSLLSWDLAPHSLTWAMVTTSKVLLLMISPKKVSLFCIQNDLLKMQMQIQFTL